jgi:hypothetical protein
MWTIKKDFSLRFNKKPQNQLNSDREKQKAIPISVGRAAMVLFQ